MEITTVYYKSGDFRQEHTGPFVVTAAGLVLSLGNHSQLFVPYSQVLKIEQTFTGSTPDNERMNKSLATRFRSIS